MEHSHFNILVPLKSDRYLVYNSLSLKFLVISKQAYFDLISPEQSPFDIKILDCIDKGFLAPSAQEQYNDVADRDNLFKKSSPFIHLTIMMSESCNFSCGYCNQGQVKDKTILSDEVISEVCSYIHAVSCKNSVVDISWFGGEPLLSLNQLLKSSDRVRTVCQSIHAKYNARVLTNGFLFTVACAKKLYNHGISVAQVSFDGDRTSHNNSRYVIKGIDTYELILANLKDVLETVPEFKISLRVNVSAANVNSLPALISDLVSKGFNNYKNFVVYFGHIYDPTRSDIDDAPSIDDILLDHKAFALAELKMNRLLLQNGFRASHTINETRGNCIATQSNSFVLRPDGQLHKCYIPVSNEKNSCGSIFEVNKVFESENYKKWNSWSAFSEDTCSQCKLLGSCRGGCPINYISEDYSSVTYKCPPSKLYLNEYLFDRALASGLLVKNDWDELLSPTKQEDLRMKISP